MDAPSQQASPSFFTIGNQRVSVPIQPPWVMGIVNVTPDSFSDGGVFLDPECAVARALQQIEEGAPVIDVGGESTRPGSRPVPAAEQIRRVIPVIEGLQSKNSRIFISIDTTAAEVAQSALHAGASIVNDTSSLRDDPNMIDVVARARASVVLMHRKGTPHDMQQGGGPLYEDVVAEIMDFLTQRIEFAVRGGIDRERIAIDPGIGFGKRDADNLVILQQVRRFNQLGCPVVIGASRKRFIGKVLNEAEPRDRVIGSVACATITALGGASIVRAHDVLPTVQAINMALAIQSGQV